MSEIKNVGLWTALFIIIWIIGFAYGWCSGYEYVFDLQEDTELFGIVFNHDGTKLFVVNEYHCATGFNVSTCSMLIRGNSTKS